MGSTEDEVARLLAEAKAKNRVRWYIERLAAEGPKHRVRITKPFWLSRHEVTRGQFRQFVDDRGYQTEAERDGKGGYGLVNHQWVQNPRFVWNTDLGVEQTDDHPVVNVSWNDVTAFCEWLSEKEGVTCHLPSEAQWEYACCAGTTTSWHCGDNETTLQEYAWFNVNSDGSLHPVGQLRPNAWGLYDVLSNAREWCQDRYATDYYVGSPLDDPVGAAGVNRVVRGGSWGSDGGDCRSAHRGAGAPGNGNVDLGFRVAQVGLVNKSSSTSKSGAGSGG